MCTASASCPASTSCKSRNRYTHNSRNANPSHSNYYGPQIYQILGIGTGTALQIIGISGSLSIIWTTLALLSLDRVGRVKPLIVSAAGMAAALLVNSVMARFYVVADNANPNNDALRAMVAMNFVFSFFFTPVGVISWVYPAEVSSPPRQPDLFTDTPIQIFPAEIRARGNSASTFTNWSLNLIFAQCAPIGLENIGFSFFYFFFAANLVACVCYAIFYPETKGRTLEQMDQLFGDQLVPHVLQHPEKADLSLEEKMEHVAETTKEA